MEILGSVSCMMHDLQGIDMNVQITKGAVIISYDSIARKNFLTISNKAMREIIVGYHKAREKPSEISIYKGKDAGVFNRKRHGSYGYELGLSTISNMYLRSDVYKGGSKPIVITMRVSGCTDYTLTFTRKTMDAIVKAWLKERVHG